MRWRTAKLGSLCEVIRGSSPRPKGDPRYFGGPIPWISIADVTREEGKYLTRTREGVTPEGAKRSRPVPAGTLIVSNSATICVPKILKIDGCIHDGFVALSSLTPQADINFLFHYFNAVREEVRAKNTQGVTQVNLNTGIFKAMDVPVPPLAEQRRIADVLDRAEALRAKRRGALARLDILQQAIFLDLFGNPLVNPKRWPNPTLGELLTFQQYGPRFFNESYSADGIRIVRITDLNEAGTLNFSEMPRMAVSDVDRGKYALRPGDLIFARSGATVGKVALIQADDPPCIAGAYFITMRFAEALEPVYARAVLTFPTIRAIVIARSRQAAQQNFSGPGLRQLPMPLPPLALQRDFAWRVEAIERMKVAQRASLAEFDALFVSLQHRAFRGEL